MIESSDDSGIHGDEGNKSTAIFTGKMMDVDGAGSGAGGGGSGGEIGPVASPVSNLKSHGYKITSAGTTWINTTSTGNVGIDWTTFPWEFPQLFMNDNERRELYNDYLFWKCNSVTVNFKNFRGYVNSVPSTGVDPQTFPTDNAAFQTYIDEMYYLGVQTHPFVTESSWLAQADIVQLMRSWQKGGYDGSSRISLPIFDIPVTESYENIISQNYPNVTQTQGVAGEVVSHTWHTSGDKWWRCTSEFINGTGTVVTDTIPTPTEPLIWPHTNRFFRADEFGGIVLAGNTDAVWNHAYFNGVDPATTAREATSGAIPPTLYSTHEPIAPLLLRIVPQHIEGNGNSTHLQFDFEITYNISVRCKIPRHGYTGNNDMTQAAIVALAGTTAGIDRPGSKTPIIINYPSLLPGGTKTGLMPQNANDIQRGRTKNGFVFLPYAGWEAIVRNAPSPPPVPRVRATRAAFDQYVHVVDDKIGDPSSQVPDSYSEVELLRYDAQGNEVIAECYIAEFLQQLTIQGLWLVPSARLNASPAVIPGYKPFDTTLTTIPDKNFFPQCVIGSGEFLLTNTPTYRAYTSFYFTDIPPVFLPSGTAPAAHPSDAESLAAYLDSTIKAHLAQ